MSDQIIIGGSGPQSFYFGADAIRSITITEALDIIGSQLSIDIIVPTVEYEYTGEGGVEILAGADFDEAVSTDGYVIATSRTYDDLRLTPYGAPLFYYRDGVLQVKAYVKSVDRIGKRTYKINAMSAIGILDQQVHLGGLYTGQTFSAVLAEIIDSVVPYTVANDVATVTVYGWLPVDTKRANLHKLLFSAGVAVRKNEAGNMDFVFLSNMESSTIPQSRIYIGGSVDYADPATAVQVTEHTFSALQNDETVLVYDNTDGSETADHTFIAFQDAPLHDLAVTGTLTINSSGVNWAIVTGTGTLTGKKYTHATKVITKQDPDATGIYENVVQVTDCTLVTTLNSENVAERVLSYYSSKKTVASDIVMQGEKPGMLITATDAFYEPITGYITQIETNVSAINKGRAKIVTGYTPNAGGNNYSEAHQYTGSGSIDFAALVAGKDNDLVKVTLIGGGHGGYAGEDGGTGTRSEQGTSAKYGTPGVGGAGGAPGEGGKVYVVTFHVSDLVSTTLAYACGAGGGSNASGGATTLGDWTSNAGAPAPNGVANIFTSEVFGMAGTENGQAGGTGSGNNAPGPDISYGGQTWHAGAKGSNASSGDYWASGGFGGGAAVGSDGGDGQDAEPYSGGVSSGSGGDGAPGGAGAAASQYGCGGNGGHGGGGAGVGGVRRSSGWYYPDYNGNGGAGGPGGQGGAGLIIVYV